MFGEWLLPTRSTPANLVFPNGFKLRLASVYLPPHTSHHANPLGLLRITEGAGAVIVGGDFNAHSTLWYDFAEGEGLPLGCLQQGH